MIVVAGFLHQVEDCPHKRITKHGKAVPGADHYKHCQDGHRTHIPVHAGPGQRMKEFKPYERKCEWR